MHLRLTSSQSSDQSLLDGLVGGVLLGLVLAGVAVTVFLVSGSAAFLRVGLGPFRSICLFFVVGVITGLLTGVVSPLARRRGFAMLIGVLFSVAPFALVTSLVAPHTWSDQEVTSAGVIAALLLGPLLGWAIARSHPAR